MATIIVKSEKDLSKIKAGDTVTFDLGVDVSSIEDPFEAEELLQKENKLIEKMNERLSQSDEKDIYKSLSVGEMRKAFTKAENAKKAESLGIKVFKSWNEKKICEAIYNHFN